MLKTLFMWFFVYIPALLVWIGFFMGLFGYGFEYV